MDLKDLWNKNGPVRSVPNPGGPGNPGGMPGGPGGPVNGGPNSGPKGGPNGAPNGNPNRQGGKRSKKSGGTLNLKLIIGILVLIAIAEIGYTSFYRVTEQENAVVTMFGNIVRTDTAGLYFKIPFIQKVQFVDMTTHGTGIGYTVSDSGQNITNEDDGVMITSDFNLLNIDFYLEYKVSDPVAYIYNSTKPEEILRNMTLASIRSTIIDYTVDDAMTTGKSQIQADVKEKLTKELTESPIGLQVVNISIQDAEPPTTEIVSAFKNVENAKQGKDTAINTAKKYQNEQIPAAEAEADRILQTAQANKAARIAEAEGQVSRFNAMYEQYALNPLITKQRMFYETMEEILPGTKVIITDGQTQTILPLDDFTGGTAGGAADGAASGDAGSSEDN